MFTGLGRVASADLRHHRRPAAILGVAIVIASASFVLLTASVRTSEATVAGAVFANFVTSYDVLVRPEGSRTAMENSANLVRPNFETAIYGGITEAQWRQIQEIPGVEVAAPVAYVGFTSMFSGFPVDVTDYVSTAPADQLLRLRKTWMANSGLSQHSGSTAYIYVTSTPGGCAEKIISSPESTSPFFDTGPRNAYLTCYERASQGNSAQRYTVEMNPQYSMLIAGIDPAEEDALVGLNGAITDGRSLTSTDTVGLRDGANVIPVLAPSDTYQDESLAVAVESVDLPLGTTYAALLNEPDRPNAPVPQPNAAYERVTPLPGTPLGAFEIAYDELYQNHIEQLRQPFVYGFGVNHPGFDIYWQAGPVDYAASNVRGGVGTLEPLVVENDPEVWRNPPGTGGGYYAAAPDNQDVGFRTLAPHQAVRVGEAIGMFPEVVGTFSPQALADQGQVNEVPLQLYAPPLVTGADAASRAALADRPLGPTANIAGYVSQPAALVTTLDGAKALLGEYFADANSQAPISVIRVRVAGVAGADEASLERIKRVAAAISDLTGLTVDITAGSSPQPQTVALPAGHFGQPALTVTEGWSRKGVSVVILDAVDRKSAALFALILIVTATFLTTAAWTSVRARRAELGILRALGWRPRHLFAAIVVQTPVVGLVAGLVGAAVAFVLIQALSLDMPATRALLVVPLAVVLAVLSGLAPALQAARGAPMDAVAHEVAPARRSRRIKGMTSLALNNLRRRPGRTVAAALGLVVGVAALVILVGITVAYQELVTGTALTDFVRSSTRGVDYLAIGLVFLLAAIAIADVVALNIRERSAEFATLQAMGWTHRHIVGVIGRESLLIGLFAGILGATLGVSLGSLTGAPIMTLLITGVIAAIVGTLLAGGAGLVPALAGIRRGVAHTLSEE